MQATTVRCSVQQAARGAAPARGSRAAAPAAFVGMRRTGIVDAAHMEPCATQQASRGAGRAETTTWLLNTGACRPLRTVGRAFAPPGMPSRRVTAPACLPAAARPCRRPCDRRARRRRPLCDRDGCCRGPQEDPGELLNGLASFVALPCEVAAACPSSQAAPRAFPPPACLPARRTRRACTATLHRLLTPQLLCRLRADAGRHALHWRVPGAHAGGGGARRHAADARQEAGDVPHP